MLGSLLQASHRLHPDDLPALVASHARRLGGEDAALYVVDISQRQLVPLRLSAKDPLPNLAVDGTLPGRAFKGVTVISGEADGNARRLWLPLLDGGERVGLLGVTVAHEDPATVERFERLASLLAQLVVTKSQYGDGILVARRLQEMDLAAELRWALLPPLTCTAGPVTISGILEPAYEIAGDAFDYAVNGDVAHVAIVDAVGHGLEASRIANLAVAVYRNARRRNAAMEATFRMMDEIVATHCGDELFLTGQLAELSLSTGVMRWLNAGHPRPILLRENRDVGELRCDPCLPIGLGGISSEVAHVSLEPNDSVLFFTDGVVESRSAAGELFGRDRLGDLLARTSASGERPAEVMRRLCRAVLEHAGSHLRDDATLLLVHWSGPQRR